jgi:hypothetical protein
MSGTYPVAVSEYGLGVGGVGGEIGKHGCSILAEEINSVYIWMRMTTLALRERRGTLTT